MATIEELSAALVKADAAGDTVGAKVLADHIRAMSTTAPARVGTSADIPLAPGAAERMAAEAASRTPEAPDSLFGKIAAPFEAAASIGTGMIGGLAGAIRGGPLAIPFSDAKDAKALEEEGGKLAESMTYQPRSQAGRHIVETVGKGLVDSGIIGIPIPELNALGRGLSSSGAAVRDLAGANAGAMAAQDAAAAAGAQPLRNLLSRNPTGYHGTQANFANFSDAYSGAATGVGRGTGLGTWFSSDKDAAAIFSRVGNSPGSGRIVEANLRMQNPYTMSDGEFTRLMMSTSDLSPEAQHAAMRQVQTNLKLAGYDGIVIPRQVRSERVAVPENARGVLASDTIEIPPALKGSEGGGDRYVVFDSAAIDIPRPVAPTKLRDLVAQRRAAMSGVGAAETDAAKMRMQTAANLPIPPKLTRSQATRNFADIQFEREKAKMGVEGAPLRARFDEQNKNLGQNMDAFIDETGAVAPNDRTLGTMVVNAAEQRSQALKANIDAEYAAARANGEMAEPINIRSLMQYLEDNRTSAEVAPILNSIEKSLGKKASQVPAQLGGEGVVKVDPLNKTISLNDLEKVRQQIYAEIEHGTPGEVKGLAMRDLIDQATEGKGGPLYQQARRSFENYANEFKGRGVISKLLGTKTGTKDRAVAFEDVLDHLTGQGASLDDVRWVRRTLMAAGDDGVQAWKEVQGGLLRKIKREVYSNISNDENGVANASPAKLNKSIENLDLDGKLEFIYGKEGAQRLRDLNEHSKTILTTPPGAVNFSNSSSAILTALAADFPLSAATGIPAPIATALTFGVKGVKNKMLKRKIQSHLDYEPTPLEVRVDLARQAQADKASQAAANAQAQSNLRTRVEAARQQKAANIAGAQSVDEAIKAFSAPTDQP